MIAALMLMFVFLQYTPHQAPGTVQAQNAPPPYKPQQHGGAYKN